MKKHVLSVPGYIVATFAAQATSHFVLFSNHYTEVTHISKEPIFALGFSSMIIQGSILSFLFSRSQFYGKSLFDAIKVAWLFGFFLLSYIGLAEAGKYVVPNIAGWIGGEFLVGFVQFTLAGVLLGIAHRKNSNGF